MEKIRLNELLEKLSIPCGDTRIVLGISDHSKEIQKDYLFVLRDHTQHAKEYIQEALDKGGIVLCDQKRKEENVYVCENIETTIPILMKECYGDQCASFCVIGVSGTSGKTSVASFITQLLNIQGHSVMQIGTGFVKMKEKRITTQNTTPNAFQLAHYFSLAHQQNISYVVMEVSSHAIGQKRIQYLRFDMIAYTNITQDHLDYHLSKTQYRYTKFQLRKYLKKNGKLIYNNEDPHMQELVHLNHNEGISFGNEEAHFPMREIKCSGHDIAFTLQGYAYTASLLGFMNVYNLSEALVVMRLLQVSYEKLQEDCGKIKPVPGRMEVLVHGSICVWIDYAHTIDALQQVLLFANEIKQGRILTILGCGGNRDRTKRSPMGDIAAQYSDIALFTSDNPREERICDILKDMMAHRHKNVEVFENRFFAIKHAVKIAQKGDIIIIAGKGNEQSQSIHGLEIPFSDQNVVKKLLKEELSWK